jgi:hypothetical protein
MGLYRYLLLLIVTAMAGATHAGDDLAACVASCDAIEVECSSTARGATQQCMRAAATGGIDPLSMRRDLSTYYCGYFHEPRCDGARDAAGCALRYTALYTLCGDYYTDNVAGRYFDCKASESNSLELCHDELLACRASCE